MARVCPHDGQSQQLPHLGSITKITKSWVPHCGSVFEQAAGSLKKASHNMVVHHTNPTKEELARAVVQAKAALSQCGTCRGSGSIRWYVHVAVGCQLGSPFLHFCFDKWLHERRYVVLLFGEAFSFDSKSAVRTSASCSVKKGVYIYNLPEPSFDCLVWMSKSD